MRLELYSASQGYLGSIHDEYVRQWLTLGSIHMGNRSTIPVHILTVCGEHLERILTMPRDEHGELKLHSDKLYYEARYENQPVEATKTIALHDRMVIECLRMNLHDILNFSPTQPLSAWGMSTQGWKTV